MNTGSAQSADPETDQIAASGCDLSEAEPGSGVGGAWHFHDQEPANLIHFPPPSIRLVPLPAIRSAEYCSKLPLPRLITVTILNTASVITFLHGEMPGAKHECIHCRLKAAKRWLKDQYTASSCYVLSENYA
jgi:hypothetical protein